MKGRSRQGGQTLTGLERKERQGRRAGFGDGGCPTSASPRCDGCVPERHACASRATPTVREPLPRPFSLRVDPRGRPGPGNAGAKGRRTPTLPASTGLPARCPRGTRPQAGISRWPRRAPSSPRARMRSPEPARRERKSRDPGSGRPGARGWGGDVRHSVREGARERRGRGSGERGRRGRLVRWASGRGSRGGGGGGPRLCSRRPPRPPRPPACPPEGSALGGGGGDSGRRPGRRGSPRANRGRRRREAAARELEGERWGRRGRGRELGMHRGAGLFCGRSSCSAAPSSPVHASLLRPDAHSPEPCGPRAPPRAPAAPCPDCGPCRKCAPRDRT